MNAFKLLLLLASACLIGCQTGPTPERRSAQQVTTASDFASRSIVEVAVLPVRTPPAVSPAIATDLRRVAHDYIRSQKRYSTLRFEVIDGANGPSTSEDPATALRRCGADAVLVIDLTEVDRRELGSHGRVWSSGAITLVGPEGVQLWRSTFENHQEIVMSASNPGTADEQLFDTLRALLRDKLSALPLKKPLAER